MGRRPAGMRSGSSVDTPDNYVLGLAKMSRDFGPAVVQIFPDKTCGKSDAKNKPSPERSQKNTDHIFSADSLNC